MVHVGYDDSQLASVRPLSQREPRSLVINHWSQSAGLYQIIIVLSMFVSHKHVAMLQRIQALTQSAMTFKNMIDKQ